MYKSTYINLCNHTKILNLSINVLKNIDIIVRTCYNIITVKERSETMSKQKKPKGKKKSGNQNSTVQKVVLITAILNLLKALVDLIDRLTE